MPTRTAKPSVKAKPPPEKATERAPAAGYVRIIPKPSTTTRVVDTRPEVRMHSAQELRFAASTDTKVPASLLNVPRTLPTPSTVVERPATVTTFPSLIKPIIAPARTTIIGIATTAPIQSMTASTSIQPRTVTPMDRLNARLRTELKGPTVTTMSRLGARTRTESVTPTIPVVTQAPPVAAAPVKIDVEYVQTKILQRMDTLFQQRDDIELRTLLTTWTEQAPPAYRTTQKMNKDEFLQFVTEVRQTLKTYPKLAQPERWAELEAKSERDIAYCPLRWMVSCTSERGLVNSRLYRELLKGLGMPENTPDELILAMANTRLAAETRSRHIRDMKEVTPAVVMKGDRRCEEILTRLFVQSVGAATQDIVELATLCKATLPIADLVKRMNEVAVLEQDVLDERKQRLLKRMKEEAVSAHSGDAIIGELAPDLRNKLMQWKHVDEAGE